MFCPMSHIWSVTARLASQWQISSQHLAPLPICVKIFHSQYYMVAMTIHTQSLCSLDMCIYTHTFFTTQRCQSGKINKKKEWDSSECLVPRKSFLVPLIHRPWPSAIQVINQWKTTGTEETLDVISWPEKGEQIVNKWHNVRLAHSTTCTIQDDAHRIKESAKCFNNKKCQQSKTGSIYVARLPLSY
jgi:hypothetical protein